MYLYPFSIYKFPYKCMKVALLPLRTLFASIPISMANQIRFVNTTPRAVPCAKLFQVPANETSSFSEQTLFSRYTLSGKRKGGKGVAVVWFRNDLRVLDNEALFRAWDCSETVLPLYCVDPRLFEKTCTFGFPKTGALRAQFLIESLADLKKNLMKLGLNLLIKHGKPEEIIPSIVDAVKAHTVYAQKETCSEETDVEKSVTSVLKGVKLQLVWGLTMYHIDDLPFHCSNLPDIYTQFQSNSNVRGCYKIPTSLGPSPNMEDWGTVPTLQQLGLQEEKVTKGMRFLGGETAALSRVGEYFWSKDLLKSYKETRNGMLGPDYSTKFSPWLASGSLSPRFLYEEVKRYEKERLANDSTYWVLFELIWRDYFRFLSIKCGNSLFLVGGPRKLNPQWSQNKPLFEAWRDGCTGYPLIDANMKELSTTGFMSNRGRQIVCSFLVRDMDIDWRMGAEWFETCLLDYDPCSNYGNWTYGAGVGNDPREDRYFSIPKQASTYDREGNYVAYWLPQLQSLPKEKRNFPGPMYIEQIVPLKHGSTYHKNNNDKDSVGGKRRASNVAKQTKGYRG